MYLYCKSHFESPGEDLCESPWRPNALSCGRAQYHGFRAALTKPVRVTRIPDLPGGTYVLSAFLLHSLPRRTSATLYISDVAGVLRTSTHATGAENPLNGET
jgi:hypothetical protein